MPESQAQGPQIEDGYTRIANELLEALCKWKCSDYERRLTMAIIRLTYGIYGRKKAKIENQELVEMTGIADQNICRTRNHLVKMKVIKVIRTDNRRALTYEFNKYYKTWKSLSPEIKRPQADNKAIPGDKKVIPAETTPYKENIKKTKRKEKGEPEKKPAPPPPPYEKIIEYLNAATGSKYDHKSKETRAAIRARFKTGYSEQDFYDVISVKTDQWLGDNKMVAYLRPSTLFRPTNFEDYLQEARRSKTLMKSEKQKFKERRFKIAAGIMRESGQEACLRYCQDNNVDAEEFKTWISKNIGN